MKKEARQQLVNEILNRCQINKENSFKMTNHDTSWMGTEEIQELGEKKLKKKAKKILKILRT
jgi:hypothetical protein